MNSRNGLNWAVLTNYLFIMQTRLEKTTETLIDVAIEEVFYQLHKKFATDSGDIMPDQDFWLDYYKKKLAKICVEVIKQNQ